MFVWALVDAVYVAGKRRGQPPAKFNRWSLTLALLLALINSIAGGTRFYISRILHVGAYVMASSSMSPTLRAGDRIVVDTSAYSTEPPKRGDVVAFVRPGSGETIWAKRIVAVGGDVIEGADNVKVNGQLAKEPYLPPPDDSEAPTDPFGPLIVPPNAYFVMGDDRRNSNDSREFGFIERSQLRGKILYLYWSGDRSRIGKTIR